MLELFRFEDFPNMVAVVMIVASSSYYKKAERQPTFVEKVAKRKVWN